MLFVLAEKPSLAEDIAHAVMSPESCRREAAGFSGTCVKTGRDMIVAFCAGHLLELVMPEAYNPAWANWRIEDLPIEPPNMHFKLAPRDGDADRLLKAIEYQSKGATEIVNACDAGREGELIFWETAYYLQLAFSKGRKITRMWIQDPTDAGLRRAFSERQPAESKKLTLMREVAILRQKSDWLYGCNMSRYVSLSVAQHPKFPVRRHAIGRVQTAVLGVIHERSTQVSGFEAEPYYRIRITLMGKAEAFTAYLVAEKEQQFGRSDTMFKDYDIARDLVRELHFSAHDWDVFDESPTSEENPPEPFNLVELQRSCYRIFGWSAKYTLAVAQECYAKEKTLTYPRTESFHLPMSMREEAIKLRSVVWDKHILTQFKAAKNLPPFECHSRYFRDDDKMEEHHAIIPTGKIPGRLNEKGAVKHTYLLWDLVVRRFVMSLQEPAISKECSRILLFTDPRDSSKEYRAIFKSEPLVKAAWLETEEIIGNTRGYGKDLSNRLRDKFPECDATAAMLKVEWVKDYTKRPEEFNDDTILGKMMRMKLGTAATRAEIVEKLITREYIERTPSGSLTPRIMGAHLVSELNRIDAKELLSPEVTSKWEKAFDLIEKGKTEDGEEEYQGPDRFLKALMAQITAMGVKIHNNSVKGTGSAKQDDGTVFCPVSFKPVTSDQHFYYFAGYKAFACPKFFIGRAMKDSEWRDILLANPKVGGGPFDGFKGKKGGDGFTASVAYRKKPTKWGHFELVFDKKRK